MVLSTVNRLILAPEARSSEKWTPTVFTERLNGNDFIQITVAILSWYISYKDYTSIDGDCLFAHSTLRI
jgi:hypothetical protein